MQVKKTAAQGAAVGGTAGAVMGYHGGHNLRKTGGPILSHIHPGKMAAHTGIHLGIAGAAVGAGVGLMRRSTHRGIDRKQPM